MFCQDVCSLSQQSSLEDKPIRPVASCGGGYDDTMPAKPDTAPHLAEGNPISPYRSYSWPSHTPTATGTGWTFASWTADDDATPNPISLHKRSQCIDSRGFRMYPLRVCTAAPPLYPPGCGSASPPVSLDMPQHGVLEQGVGPLYPKLLASVSICSWDVDADAEASGLRAVDMPHVAVRLRSTSPISAVFQRSMSTSSHQQLQLSLQGAPPAGMTAGRGRGGAGSRVYSRGGAPTAGHWAHARSNTWQSDMSSPVYINTAGRGYTQQLRIAGDSPPMESRADPDAGSGAGDARQEGHHRNPMNQHHSQPTCPKVAVVRQVHLSWSAAAPPLYPLRPPQDSMQAVRLRVLSQDSSSALIPVGCYSDEPQAVWIGGGGSGGVSAAAPPLAPQGAAMAVTTPGRGRHHHAQAVQVPAPAGIKNGFCTARSTWASIVPGGEGMVLNPSMAALSTGHVRTDARDREVLQASRSLSGVHGSILGTPSAHEAVFLPRHRLNALAEAPAAAARQAGPWQSAAEAPAAAAAATAMAHGLQHWGAYHCVPEANTSSETELCGDSFSLPVVLIAADSSSEDGLGE